MEKTNTSVGVLKEEISKVKDNALLIGFFKDEVGLSIQAGDGIRHG